MTLLATALVQDLDTRGPDQQSSGVRLGQNSVVVNGAVVIGAGATALLAGQFVVGSDVAPLTDLALGRGLSSNTPDASMTLRATRANLLTNVVGSSLSIESGAGTGDATVSTLSFKTPTVGVSGSLQQVMANRLILSETGAQVIGDLSITGALSVGGGGGVTLDSLNLGSATEAVDPGDLAAHTAAAGGLFYDASTGVLRVPSLDVDGTITTIDTTNLLIEDRFAIVAKNAVVGASAGFAIERGSTGDDAIMMWSETNSRFEFGFADTTGGTTNPASVTVLGNAAFGGITVQGIASGTEQFGAGATASGLNSTAVGAGASSGTNTNCTVMGQGAAVSFSGAGTGSNNTIVIGRGSSYDNVFSSLANAVVIGTGTTVTGGNNDCIIGSANTFTGGNNAYVGSLTTGTTQAAAIGTFMQLGARAAAVGDSVIATGADNVVMGASASSGGFNNTTILGRSAIASGNFAVAIGSGTLAGANSIAITGSASLGGFAAGNGSIESGTFGVSLGNSTVSGSQHNVAVGSFSYAERVDSTVLGGRSVTGGQRTTVVGANSFPIRTATITVNDLLGAGGTITFNNSASQATVVGTEGVDFTIGVDVDATAASIQGWLNGLTNMTATVLTNVVTVFNANSQGYITALVSSAPGSWAVALEAEVNDTVMVGEGISAVRSGDSTLVGQGITLTFSGAAQAANSATLIGQGITYNSLTPGGSARAVVIGDNITSLLGDRDTLVGSFISTTGGLNAIVGSSVIAASQSCGVGRSMQLGIRSIGMGDGVVSTGNDSVVLGAVGNDGGFQQSTLIGAATVSTGIRAVAIGSGTSAGQDAIAIRGTAGLNGVAIGAASVATGNASVGIGNAASATGALSVAIGLIASASGSDSVCIGRQAIDNANANANMFGFNTMATGVRAIGIGSNLSVAKDGIAIGSGLTAPANTCLIGNGSGIGGTYLTKVVFGGGEVVNVAGGAVQDLALGVSGAFSSTNNDRQGGNFEIFSGPGTGIGVTSTLKISGPIKGVTGSAPQLLNTRLLLNEVATGSMALGADTAANALGTESVAVGGGAGASGAFANVTTLGFGATATISGGATANANAVVIGRNANSNMSVGGSSQSVCIGNSASTQAQFTTAVGDNSSCVGIRSTSLGQNASCTATDALALGFNTVAGSVAVAVGANASATGGNSLAFGQGTSSSHANSIVFGRAGTSTATNQFIVGSDQQLINTTILGEGDVRSTTGVMTDMLLRTTDRTTVTDESGKNFVIRSGRGTGAAPVTSVVIQTPTLGTTGAVTQSVAPRLKLSQDTIDFQGLGMPTTWSSTAIDLKATGDVTLFTVPTGRTFLFQRVVLHITTALTANGDSQVSVGVNGAQDIIPQTGSTGLDTVNEAVQLIPDHDAVFQVAVAGDTIDLGRDVADTGTTLSGTAYLVGILI